MTLRHSLRLRQNLRFGAEEALAIMGVTRMLKDAPLLTSNASALGINLKKV
ncbi:MAG: hypothetical protein ABIV48_05515 [Pyrinomonadaceae bacterium]